MRFDNGVKECYVLQRCNEWKEYSSATMVGVFDDYNVLLDVIVFMFLNDEINWRGQSVNEIENDVVKKGEEDDLSTYEIKELIDKAIKLITDDIRSSNISNLDSGIEFAMIQVFNMNTYN